MDLLIAILMMMGVNATQDSFKDQEFLNRNELQIKEAQQKADELKANGQDEKTIVVLGGGNG